MEFILLIAVLIVGIAGVGLTAYGRHVYAQDAAKLPRDANDSE